MMINIYRVSVLLAHECAIVKKSSVAPVPWDAPLNHILKLFSNQWKCKRSGKRK